MNIFIGSSTKHLIGTQSACNEGQIKKHNSLAYQIYEKLKTEHAIIPWWGEETFGNNPFFDTLIDLAHSCDFGIFILDKNELELDKEEEKYLTNENVLIELGMFIVAKKSLKNVYFVAEEGLSLPSDLGHINTLKFSPSSENFDPIFKGVRSKIESSKNGDNNKDITIRFNQAALNDSANDTFNKDIYHGLIAAKLWKDIEADPDYLDPDFYKTLGREFVAKNEHLKGLSNFVSLGCGVGIVDYAFMAPSDLTDMKYIPVDINPYLVVDSMQKMYCEAGTNKIYGIVDNFETNVGDSINIIKAITHDKPSLYALIGGTFCNLDDPHAFLLNWSIEIDRQDRLIIDVIVMNESYTPKNDIDTRIDGNQKIVKLMNNSLKYKNQISGNFLNSQNVINYMRHPEDNNFQKYLNRNIERNDDYTKFTWWFQCQDDEEMGNKNKLFSMVRYQKKSIESTINGHFEILDTNEKVVDDNISKVHYILQKR